MPANDPHKKKSSAAPVERPDEAAPRNRDNAQVIELRQVVGGGIVSGQQQHQPRDVGVERPPEPLFGSGQRTRTSPMKGMSTVTPGRSLFGADLAAVALAIFLVGLIVYALLTYQNSGPRRTQSDGNPQAVVWVEKGSGLYFCAGNKYYGKGTGEYMTQRSARLRSFRPALYLPCE